MRTLLLVALVLGGAASLEAQVDWVTRKGFWIGFGLGGGPNLSTGFDGESMWGYGGHLKLGGTPSQKFLLGAESLVWGRNDGGEEKRRGNVHVMAQFYPPRDKWVFPEGRGRSGICPGRLREHRGVRQGRLRGRLRTGLF